MIRLQPPAGPPGSCGLIVCLSHLGYAYSDPNRPSDRTLAAEVPNIDLILGGHTHTFFDQAEVIRHSTDLPVMLINQTGWGGMRLGRIDLVFDLADTASTPSGRKPTYTRSGTRWASARYDIDSRLDE